jgi:hypothetical protein
MCVTYVVHELASIEISDPVEKYTDAAGFWAKIIPDPEKGTVDPEAIMVLSYLLRILLDPVDT